MKKVLIATIFLLQILLTGCSVDQIVEYLGYLGARVERNNLNISQIKQEGALDCSAACAQMWSKYNNGSMLTQSEYITIFNNMSGDIFHKVSNGFNHCGITSSAWVENFNYDQDDRLLSYASLFVRNNNQPILPITHQGYYSGSAPIYHAWLITGYEFKRNGIYSDRIQVLSCKVNDPNERIRTSMGLDDLKHDYLRLGSLHHVVVGTGNPASVRSTADAWYTNFVNSGSSYYGGPIHLDICQPIQGRKK